MGGAAIADQPGGLSPILPPDRRDEAAHHTDSPAWPVQVDRPFTWAALDDDDVAVDEPPPVRVQRLQLPLRFEALAWDLLATLGALARLTVDDRFPKHRRKVIEQNLADLDRAAALLHDLRVDLRWSDRWSQ